MAALVAWRAAMRVPSIYELAIEMLGSLGFPTAIMQLIPTALKTSMWAIVIKTATDSFVELDPWELLGPGVSAYGGSTSDVPDHNAILVRLTIL